MGKEIERKFVLKDGIDLLLGKKKKTIGIIQWYLPPNEENGRKIQRRIRLEIFNEKNSFRHLWTYTEKEKINGDTAVRIEREETIDFSEIKDSKNPVLKNISGNLQGLMEYPCVNKLRHFFDAGNPLAISECVLDEFLQVGDNSANRVLPVATAFSADYLLEIELNQGAENKDLYFQDVLSSLDISDKVREVTNEKEYENEKIAQNLEEKVFNIIEFLENRLKGPQTLIMLLGLSLFSNIAKQLKIETKEFSVTEFKDSILEKYNLTVGQITGRNPFNKKDKQKFLGLSAEMDTLILLEKKGIAVENLTLMVFPDKGKDFFDKKLMIPEILPYLSNFISNFYPEIEIKSISIDYSPKDEGKIMGTFEKIWDKIEEVKFENIIIDVTGGPKFPGIILALYCMFNKRPFLYKQDGSGILIQFPSAPVNWDFQNIDSFHTILNDLKSKINYDEYFSLPTEVKNMFCFFQHEGKEVSSLLPVGKINKQYRENRDMPFGYGIRLLSFIEDPNKRDWIIKNIIQKWSLQWIGDQIPETVEHSQRHSKRLMEFTVNLINLIGEESFLLAVPEGMKDEFYFVLSVAMNIHDLGHTNNKWIFDDGTELNLDGLPGVVRDLHNELTIQMLQERKGEFNLLKGIEKPYQADWEKVEKSIKLICKYHRSYLPIDLFMKEKPKDFAKLFSLDTCPLEITAAKEFPEDKSWQELTILASRWLRFIDSTDVQADRTNSPEFKKVRIQRTKMESENILKELLSNYSEFVEREFLTKKFIEIGRYLEKELSCESNDLSIVKSRLEKLGAELEKQSYTLLETEIAKSGKAGRIKVPYEITLLSRLGFKIRQFVHFDKHQAVKMVYPSFFREKSFNEKDKGSLKILFKIDKEISEAESLLLKRDLTTDIGYEFERANISEIGSGIKKLDVIFKREEGK